MTIIAIVYLPILSLIGIEGKMFRPMAMTVLFALAGALVLSLTFIPALASLLLPRRIAEVESFPVAAARRVYRPLLARAIRRRLVTVGSAVGLFGLSAALAPCLGSEFVPKLDEGAIVLQAWRLPSVSLEESVVQTTELERILKPFPEVTTVVSKTGRAGIATDPMGVEISDVFVMLKPRDEWETASTREELIEAFDAALVKHLPGQIFSYSQPIELRVSELIAGVRSDVALKIPAGYYADWGGQFENLEKASRRLLVVVPIALGLIFVMLYMTFGSARLAGLIYLNVPFAVSGGVFALAIRGMPLSISAGVGFIALFGAAVLNGLVLIGYIVQRRGEGLAAAEAAYEGAQVRLRPVLTTALVASLGFVPMAIATGAGAEVQKLFAADRVAGLGAHGCSATARAAEAVWYLNGAVFPVPRRMPMHEMPVVTDEHRKLHVFAGDWIGDETMEPSPWGAGGPAIGKYTGRVACDGFFVLQDYTQEVDGAVTFRGHAVFGYDVPQKQFAWYWVDSTGSMPSQPAWGEWDGDTLQFTSVSPVGAGRYTYVFESDDRYRFRLENSFDGEKTWHTFMTAVYRRA